jgi:FkbM family methyltransferase
MRWYSQLGQDKYVIEEIFKKKKGGFYVDVGAHDGVYISNTYSMERFFKWEGLCIEPSAASSHALLKRKKSKVISSYCISEGKFSGELVRFRQYEPHEISMTFFEDLRKEPYWAKELESGKNYRDKLKKCKTLNEILIENSSPKDVDYISIDTHGCEWLAIKDFPFEKWNVKVFTVANDMYTGGEKEENRNKTKKLMENNGYVLNRTFSLHHLNKENWDKDFKDQVIEDLYIKQEN